MKQREGLLYGAVTFSWHKPRGYLGNIRGMSGGMCEGCSVSIVKGNVWCCTVGIF